MIGMRFEQVINALRYAAGAADVRGKIRLTLTFDTPRDRAIFETRLAMESRPSMIDDPSKWNNGQFVICGVPVDLRVNEPERFAA